MKTFNGENIKLLDNMHEGVLILSKENNQAMFCNKSAQKLLLRIVNHHEINSDLFDKSSYKKIDDEERILKLRVFSVTGMPKK